MARKKQEGAKPQTSAIRDAITAMVGELYDQHATEIEQFRADSEADKVSVNYKVELDCSESEPVVTATIRFSQSVTDKRFARLDDPNQLQLLKTRPEAEDKQGEMPANGEEQPANKRTRRVKSELENQQEQGD